MPNTSLTTSTSDDLDVEKLSRSDSLTLTWNNVTYITPGKQKIKLLNNLSGQIQSGQMMALLGPSGAGKSTFLDVLSKRKLATSGTVTINNDTNFDPAQTMSYVEQDDALLGVLTVRETVKFAAKLALPRHTSTQEINKRVDDTLSALGLTSVANNRIGTPIQRGISGGQRRRVTLACSIVANPRVLVLDEPTSGLDSVAAKQVISAIKRVTQQSNTIVICTIHQPSFETLQLFDRINFLTKGQTVFDQSPFELSNYLSNELKMKVDQFANPADVMMNLLNLDFIDSSRRHEQNERQVDSLSSCNVVEVWQSFVKRQQQQKRVEFPSENINHVSGTTKESKSSSTYMTGPSRSTSTTLMQQSAKSLNQTWTLCHRNWLNYSRNLLAFGVRLAMYAGMGLLVATIWIRLPKTDAAINDRLSVLFYGVAFLSFMSVAGIPAFLEERALFLRERRNGLYGPIPFVVANSIMTAPFMSLSSLLFTLIAYWSIPLRPGVRVFFRFLTTLFLSVYIAETQSVLIAAIVPVFVAALALTAFLNGFLMSLQGYFLRLPQMPKFWKSWAHWIDYETWSFNLLVENEFLGVNFPCQTIQNECACQFAPVSNLESLGQTLQTCAVAGKDVLQVLGIGGTSMNRAFGILVAIMIVYRLLFLLTVTIKKK
ncbi:hypothetical protein OIO90_004837 [Microbotryomycetes sp. JL221]|nr:hypothetical protein OIO90_004837 [Microbotryomycetes sp. JL221]